MKNGRPAGYILEIYRTVAGGDASLREKPMVEAFLEPISPLQFPKDGLDIVREFAHAGQPVGIRRHSTGQTWLRKAFPPPT